MGSVSFYIFMGLWIILAITILLWAISRNIIAYQLEKKYGLRSLEFMPNHKKNNNNIYHRYYGITPKQLIKFEKMLYGNEKSFYVINKNLIILAKLTGIIFYAFVVLLLLLVFCLICYKLFT